MKRHLAVLVLALATTFALGGAQDALAAPSAGPVPQGPSEIFATNNTAIITDPNDPRLDTRLVGFEVQVDSLIRHGGAQPRRSLLPDGVFWSSDLRQTTYETSREFDVARATPTELHAVADTIRDELVGGSVTRQLELILIAARTSSSAERDRGQPMRLSAR